MTFLEKSADYIFQKYKDHLSSLCIVLPNKRASLFLRKALSEHTDRPLFSPGFHTMDSVMQELSGIQIVDSINLIFELFDVHQQIEGKDAQDFDQFMKWGNVMLADFNDIDHYLIDAGKVYSYLSEAKVIDKWVLGDGELSEFETSYLRFYESLYNYYKLFTDRLLSIKQGYQGLAARHSLAQFPENDFFNKYHKLIFVGFNALATSEEKLIRLLINEDKAEVLWDADSYYMNDESQEAGKFLREYKRRWKMAEFNWIEDSLKEDEKRIQVIGVPKSIGQAKVTGEMISALPDRQGAASQTAIVLADEALLLPMLNSIPGNIHSFNVTMGLGLEHTPLFTLLDAVMAMKENASKLAATGKKGQSRFFTRDLLAILKHPYTSILEQVGDNPVLLGSVISRLNQSNKVFVSADDFRKETENCNPLAMRYFNLIFMDWQDPLDVLRGIQNLLLNLRDLFILRKEQKGDDPRLEFEFLSEFSRLSTRIINILEKHRTPIKIKTLRKVFNNMVKMSSLPFYGEPLQGIQIMGMLETRALDFDRVFILSANEGILPASRSNHSFIPFDIRMEFNLPTFREKDAIFAYHFYRLIQRANDVTLLYNTEADNLGGGDQSRFITQLIYEMPAYNEKIEIRQQLMGTMLSNELPSPVIISKSREVLDRLKEKAERGFSPSSINTYIRCPLRFYFQEVLQIGETTEIEESIDAATMGSVVHKALSKLLKPLINKGFTAKELNLGQHQIEEEVNLALGEYFKGGDTSYGKNLLITHVAVQWIKRLLNADLYGDLAFDARGWTVRYLEETFMADLKVNSGDAMIKVKIKGTIDRVDGHDRQYLLIDYKTGFVDKRLLNIQSWEKLKQDSNYAHAMQLLIYSYLLMRNTDFQNASCMAGIIAVPRPSQGILPLKLENEILETDHAVVPRIEEMLQSIFAEVFDPAFPFSQTEKVEECYYCPFLHVCGRETGG